MRQLIAIILATLSNLSFGQENYYTLVNSDSLYSENRIEEIYNIIVQNLPDNYKIKPTIFHKEFKNDTIINYLSFNQENIDDINGKREFKISYVQDSLYLLLNDKLPDFKLVDINGKQFSSSQLIGKPTMINFWATWCAPCVAEIPDLNGLKNHYGNQMNFIAITTENPKSDRLNKFLETREFNFTILFDTFSKYNNSLKIKGVPKNIFIDKFGYIRIIKGGYNPLNYIDSDEFINIIEELIKEGS